MTTTMTTMERLRNEAFTLSQLARAELARDLLTSLEREDSVDDDTYNGAGAGVRGGACCYLLGAGLVHRDRLAAAVETHDVRRAVERAEHQRDTPVVPEMGDRLGPTPREIQVRDFVGGEHSERVETLGREVHVAVGSRRRRRHEEQVLGLDQCLDCRGDLVERAGHQTPTATADAVVSTAASTARFAW